MTTLGITDSFWLQPRERQRMHVFAEGEVGLSLCGQQIKKVGSLREVSTSDPPDICKKCEFLSR